MQIPFVTTYCYSFHSSTDPLSLLTLLVIFSVLLSLTWRSSVVNALVHIFKLASNVPLCAWRWSDFQVKLWSNTQSKQLGDSYSLFFDTSRFTVYQNKNPFNLIINVNRIPSTKQHYSPFSFENKPLVTTTSITNAAFGILVVSLSRKRHPVQNKRSRNDRNLLSLNRCHGTSVLLSNIDLNFYVINAQ